MDTFALCIFSSNRGGFELLLAPAEVANVLLEGIGVREYPVALPSSDGRLEEGVDGAGTLFPSAALPVEIVARRPCLPGLGGSFGGASEVVDVGFPELALCGGSVLITVCADPYTGRLGREFSAPVNGASS